MDSDTYNWMDDAGCKDNIELFDAAADAENQAQNRIVDAAKAICLHHCSVATPCLAYALRHGEAGIWGGTTQYARNAAGGRPMRNNPNRHPSLSGGAKKVPEST